MKNLVTIEHLTYKLSKHANRFLNSDHLDTLCRPHSLGQLRIFE